jgi:CsoR family transcriptional regulator, copper-sensing transcriptional repressor
MKKKKPHADHSEALARFRRIRGQVEGVERMIADGRYCVDILNQTRSIMAALRSAEGLVMEGHVRHCVSDAVAARNRRLTEEKIGELLSLFQKR